jgi:hypothetical protein
VMPGVVVTASHTASGITMETVTTGADSMPFPLCPAASMSYARTVTTSAPGPRLPSR